MSDDDATIVSLKPDRPSLKPERISLKGQRKPLNAGTGRRSRNMFNPGTTASFAGAAGGPNIVPRKSAAMFNPQAHGAAVAPAAFKSDDAVSHILPKPRLLNEDAHKNDEKIEAAMERLSQEAPQQAPQQANIIPISERVKHKGVPLEEALSTDVKAIQEYCAREPFLLTDKRSMDGVAKFGIIPARFKAQALKWQEEMEMIDRLRNPHGAQGKGKPFLIDISKAESLTNLFTKVRAGDDLAAEYDAARAQHETFMQAYQNAADIYYKQMRDTLGALAQKMDRKQMGDYAGSMWLTNYKPNETVAFNPGFFSHDLSEQNTLLQTEAQKSALSALKWMALVINDMPKDRPVLETLAAYRAEREAQRDGADFTLH